MASVTVAIERRHKRRVQGACGWRRVIIIFFCVRRALLQLSEERCIPRLTQPVALCSWCPPFMVRSFQSALPTATGPTVSTGSMHIQSAAHATCCERVPVDGGKERVRLDGGAAAVAAAQPVARVL